MRRVVTAIAIVGVLLSMCVVSQVLFAADSATKSGADAAKANAAKTKTAAPADRVVVMYFHRTQRCPTCRRMGSYSEEAVVDGFAKQIKRGAVQFYYVDFQDERNEALTNAYQVGGPTLIVAQVVGNKVKHYRNLTEIWAKNGDKDEFLKYVRDNVAAYQKALPKTAMKRKTEETSSKTK
ncbi:MAG: nitrophenyl compound nitroreductase subunit ArsF family protein [Thermoguttaceae bacterium]